MHMRQQIKRITDLQLPTACQHPASASHRAPSRVWLGGWGALGGEMVIPRPALRQVGCHCLEGHGRRSSHGLLCFRFRGGPRKELALSARRSKDKDR